MKTTHATVRIKSADHNLSINIKFKKESTLLEKFEQIFETISSRNYLIDSKLESIYFYESEEMI
jgi:hypothetical protein